MSKKSYHVFYPSPIQEEPKDASKILSDLGRPTKRGIKKCFKCGTYNGTRGLMCKNKQCDAVFKECGEKQKATLDAIKLVSGTSRQVFSVRVRDKGPDCRGFVQLPLMQGTSTANEKNVALSEVALCFVDSCQRLFDDSILKCHEADQNKITPICIHIKSALKSVNVAIPIETKSCILNSLNCDEDVKRKLWLLSSETEGALVQRVSKTVMAVKCQVTPKHPLGYLHFTFCVTKGREAYDKFYCSCLNFKGHGYLNDNLGVFNQKCIHFYACVWAFASDLTFAEEFINFINLMLCKDNNFQKTMLNNKTLKNGTKNNSNHYLKCSKLKKTHKFHLNDITLIEMKSQQKSPRKLVIKPVLCIGKRQKCSTVLEKETTLSFLDWLTSVTERINQTLSYTQNEYIETLTYYIPSKLYKPLEERLHCHAEKVSHSTETNETSGISYLIYNIAHLKEVFDTPKVSLKIVELFIQNKEGIMISHQNEESVNQSEVELKQFVTFLKVGITKSENTCVPFTVNWDSNVLPITGFGKLELIFHIGCCDGAQCS